MVLMFLFNFNNVLAISFCFFKSSRSLEKIAIFPITSKELGVSLNLFFNASFKVTMNKPLSKVYI